MEQIELTHGPLSFTTHTCGSASAPVVLCLHGFPDNPHTFRHLLLALAEAGYRGVAPTMRGYEPSSQPENGDYTIGSMVEDVLAWIDGLGVEQVHLVGHDWGAVVAYVAAAVAPQRFSSLTTMAVPHTLRISQGVRRVPSQVFKVWYQGFFQLRGPAEWALKRNDWALVKRLCATWSPGFSLDEVEWGNRRETFEAPGVLQAMLAYYRQNLSPRIMMGFIPNEARTLTKIPVRTLALTGAEDGCIDTRLYDHVFFEEDFPAGFTVKRIEGAGHFLHLDSPDMVNALVINWIRSFMA